VNLAHTSVFVDTCEKPVIVDRTAANDGIHLDTKRGAALFQEPAPGIVVYSVAGFADVELHRMVLPDLEEAITRNGRIEFFADGGGLEGYDTQFRVEWTDWFKANRSNLVDVHVLVRSSIARMGLSVANLATGGMLRPYYSSGEFDAALRKRAPAWLRAPIRVPS
jgi:hypothetical protein